MRIDLDRLKPEEVDTVTPMERRTFLKLGLVVTGVYAGGKILSLVSNIGTAEAINFDPSMKYPYRPHYSMLIRQDRCIDCERCLMACARTNNVPEYGYRTNILQRNAPEAIGQKREFIPVLCNHCNNPPCVRACPTSATYKDEETGIVRMRPERCIGCKTCMLACPYNARYLRGRIVDKCDFCYEARLSKGMELTACAEACPADVRIFGSMSDKNSRIYRMIHQLQKPVWVLRAETGTEPFVFYMKG
ncbi:MAG TPA: 4Fe-4S dicluster domain-containing protein [Nitrospirae bacterium]|nr:4Fe-4S dicluster domain-containing protein [Nitrospirota bacterium]